MGLETATYIDGLVVTNPTGSDQKAQGDDHFRLVKTVLKNSFPTVNRAFNLAGWSEKAADVLTKSADYTMLSSDDGKIIYFDCSGASRTYNLLAIASAPTGMLVFLDRDATVANTLTIDGSGTEKINGANTLVLNAGESGFLYKFGTASNEWRFFITQSAFDIRRLLNVILSTTGDIAVFQSTDAGATRAPDVVADRFSASPAANDFIGSFVMRGRSSTAVARDYARLRGKILDATNASEDAAAIISAMIAGAETDILTIGPGVQVGAPTGGDPGAGKLNVQSDIQIGGVSIGGFERQLLHIRDEKTSGTNGGTSTDGAWTKHTLDDVKTNEISGASQASSVVTLPAGTYYIEAWAMGHRTNGMKLRWRNTSDASTAVVGANAWVSSTVNGDIAAPLRGRFTIAATKTFELQYWIEATSGAGASLGEAVTSGEVEIYAEAMIWKIA